MRHQFPCLQFHDIFRLAFILQTISRLTREKEAWFRSNFRLLCSPIPPPTALSLQFLVFLSYVAPACYSCDAKAFPESQYCCTSS